jgi:hypothetical protein
MGWARRNRLDEEERLYGEEVGGLKWMLCWAAAALGPEGGLG